MDVSSSFDSEVNSKLIHKVKVQAQRLRALDKYRELCEQRIVERGYDGANDS